MSDSLGANHLKYRGKSLLLFHSDGFFCQSQNSQPYICQILPAQLEKFKNSVREKYWPGFFQLTSIQDQKEDSPHNQEQAFRTLEIVEQMERCISILPS